MDKDPNYNPKEILRALKKRGKTKIYNYTVEVSMPVLYILDMIRNRNVVDWVAPVRPAYAVTQSFDELEEAEQYLAMSLLAGYNAKLVDNRE